MVFQICADLYMKWYDGCGVISVVALRFEMEYKECSAMGVLNLSILNISMKQ